jgi:hypothetical protein
MPPFGLPLAPGPRRTDRLRPWSRLHQVLFRCLDLVAEQTLSWAHGFRKLRFMRGGSTMTRCGRTAPPDRSFTILPRYTVAATKYGAEPPLPLCVDRHVTVRASLRKSREISAIRLGLVTHEEIGMSLAIHLYRLSRCCPSGSPGQRHRANDRALDASRPITGARALWEGNRGISRFSLFVRLG